jgi:hypothetical protein
LRLHGSLVPTNAVNPELEYHFQLALNAGAGLEVIVVLEPYWETEALKLVRQQRID